MIKDAFILDLAVYEDRGADKSHAPGVCRFK